MGAVGVIIRTRRDQFDGITTEHDQVADVLLPARHIPGVIGIGLGPVTELVPAQAVARNRRDAEIFVQCGDPWPHAQDAQEAANPEQDAPGVITNDEDHGRVFSSLDADAVTFRAVNSAVVGQFLGKFSGKRVQRRGRPDRDHRRWRRRP